MGKMYTGFLFIKFSQCIFYSAEHKLGVWLLKFWGQIFLHAGFSELLNENATHGEESLQRKFRSDHLFLSI